MNAYMTNWRARATAATAVFLLSYSMLLSSASANHREDGAAGDDFSELSLEELMEVEIVPISVLGTHTHLAGEWMVGYEFMAASMEGSRDGTSRTGVADVLGEFMVAPLEMDMEMHMPMLMYAPSDDLTLMAMLPYVKKKMKHITRTGVRFTTRSEGLGDLELSGLYTVFRQNVEEHRIIAVFGLSVPTGSIDEKDSLANPAQGRQKLPYPMQLGSGTFDLLPGVTYLGRAGRLAWGAEVDATIRLGRNSNRYSLGDRYHAAVWGDWEWTEWMAPFIRLDGESWGDVDGADPGLNPAMVQTADPNRLGGDRIDLHVGINLYVPGGMLKGQRLAIQVGKPVYQSLHGPQLEADWLLAAGWQWVF